MTAQAPAPTDDRRTDGDIIEIAREQVLERGVPLNREQLIEVLRTGDDRLEELLSLAHEVRMRYQGPAIEVEGIVSLKTGGCPEDCHFCSQSGQFTSPVRSVWLNIPELVRAAKQTRETGASEFCIVAAVRGPDDKLMAQMREGVKAIHDEVEIHVAASLGMLSQEQVDDLVDMGVHRYNHNLEAARSYFPEVVTTHTYEERWDTCRMVKESGMELCCGGLVGMGETRADRVGFIHTLATLPRHPESVPINALVPVKGTVLGDILADVPTARIEAAGVTDRLNRAAVFASLALYEPFGLGVLEAAQRIGGFGHGNHYRPRDPAAA